MQHFSIWITLILTFVGFAAGFVDSISGGGGLLNLPALLAVGMPPAFALGTNKFAGAVGELSAIFQYMRHSSLSLKRILLGLIIVLIGSSLGAILIQVMHPKVLEKLIPFLLLLVLAYTIFSKLPEETHAKPRMREHTFFILIGFIIGFYNGFFGPATGTLWVAALIFFLSFSLRDAIVYAKPLNFAGNVIAVVWFASLGHIAYVIAICMSIGSFFGGRLGARFVVYRSAHVVRYVFIALVAVLTVVLFVKYYG